MDIAQAYDRMVDRNGRDVTITRGVDSVTLKAVSVRFREQQVAGSAIQDVMLYRIKQSDIAASLLLRPREKDKITDNGVTRTINKTEEMWEKDFLVGWRLRCGG